MNSKINTKNVVTDSSITAEGDVHIGDVYNLGKSEISTSAPNKIVYQFNKASFDLAEYRNHFQNLPNSNIKRKETEQLYNWIQNENTKQNIGMLTGVAGSGKSVILRDLFHRLRNENIAVLGIKSDKNYAGNPKKLRQKTGLKEDIRKMVLKLSANKIKVILLIDQIDALSLSHSVEGKYLNTIKTLVRDLEDINGVKIIMSVRKWDLKYNPELGRINTSDDKAKTQKEFPVGLLNNKQVESILKQLDINLQKFPANLLELLKTPLHLDIFTGIYSSELDIKSLRNLHDLYSALWRNKIYNLPEKKKITTKKCTKLLNKIAQTTNVSTSKLKYESNFFKELDYLKSTGLIIGDGKTIQFFHQSFHDFVFARYFVESGMSVYDFLMKNRQNLKVRVKLKMIINYLREYDQEEYLLILQKVIKSKKVYFHIKLLLINLLGYRSNPFKGEKTIAFNYILTQKSLKEPFLESAEAEGWLNFLIEKKVIDNLFFLNHGKSEVEADFRERQKESRRFASNLLSRQLPHERVLVLNYIIKMREYDGKSSNILHILSSLKSWDLDLAKQIYTQYKPTVDDYNYSYWTRLILGDAAEFDFDWVVSMYKPYLEKKSKSTDRAVLSYDDVVFAKKLFKIDAQRAFTLYFEVVEKLCSTSTFGNYVIKPDFNFDGYTRNDKENRNREEFELLDLMIDSLQSIAKENNTFFSEFIKREQNSDYATALYILVHGFLANTKVYSDEILNFVEILNTKNALSENSLFTFSTRQLINKTYSYLTEKQKVRLNEILCNITSNYESYYYRNGEDKMVISGNMGMLKLRYITAIPEKERIKFSKINRKYHELKRKYNDIEDRASDSSFHMGPVPAPFPAAAYDYLTIEKWKQSFEKYNSDYVRDVFNDMGSRHSHADQFKKQIAKRPNEFKKYIQQIIKDEKVYFPYKLAALEGLFSANFDIVFCASIFENLIVLPEAKEYDNHFIRLTKNFIENKFMSKKVVDYLIYQALNNSDPTPKTILENEKKIKDYTIIVSTNRGTAAERLTQINFDTKFKKEILATLNQIIETDFAEVLTPILVNLRLHIKNDREQALYLFLKIVSRTKKDKVLLFKGLDCSRYLSQSHFSRIKNYLSDASQIKECQKTVSIILAWARDRGDEGSEQLHENLCKNSERARAILTEVSSHGLKNDANNQLMQDFFTRGFTDESTQVKLGYAGAFRNFTIKEFPLIYPLLKKYSKSPAAEMNLYAYYNYLQKCCDKYPKKCLMLMKNFKNNLKEDVEGNGHFRSNEPLRVVLGALNSLESSSKNNAKSIELGMKLFNKLSQYSNLRTYAQKALLESEN